MKQFHRVLGTTVLFALTAGPVAQAAFARTVASSIGAGMVAIAAALAIGISAIAVAIAMAAIGSAGAGVLAERPQAFGQILIYLVIPETLIIFGFVIAFFLNGQIG
jgi:V/A-type H+/Na+-transporting ATPase subunit K